MLDASVVLDLLLDVRPISDELRRRVTAHASSLAAPHLLDAEVGQVLRRLVKRGAIEPDRARESLADFVDLPIHRYPHTPLLQRTFELRDNATFYDGLYLALAEALDAELLTTDRALAAIPGVRAQVTVVE